jgi:hypothetical protein
LAVAVSLLLHTLFWMGRNFLLERRFLADGSSCLFYSERSFFFLLGFFAMNAEKNTMNHISTPFESLVSFLATIMFLGYGCKVVIQYCLEQQKGGFTAQLILKSQDLDIVGTG